MHEVERQRWTAPDGTPVWLCLIDEASKEGRYSRPTRHLVFESLEGQAIATVKVPLLFSLELVDPAEIEAYWRRALTQAD